MYNALPHARDGPTRAGEGGSSDEAEVTDHSPGSGQPGPADQPSSAFQRLRPLCTALLGAGSNPQALAGHLQGMFLKVAECDCRGLW